MALGSAPDRVDSDAVRRAIAWDRARSVMKGVNAITASVDIFKTTERLRHPEGFPYQHHSKFLALGSPSVGS